MGTIAGAATESPAAAAAAALLASGEGSAHSSSASSLHTADKIKRIGDWIMGETLGQGSFGKVTTTHTREQKQQARSGAGGERADNEGPGCSLLVVCWPSTGEIGASCKDQREGQCARPPDSDRATPLPMLICSLLSLVPCSPQVAIKIVDKSGIANVEDVERVYRETFILTTLKHTNIIKLFEVLDTPKSIMLVMEYAGGGELFSYVAAKHRLGEVESCRLFQQIISGVECEQTVSGRTCAVPPLAAR